MPRIHCSAPHLIAPPPSLSSFPLSSAKGRAAVARAGGARALAAMLAASFRGGRSDAERRLRVEVRASSTHLTAP